MGRSPEYPVPVVLAIGSNLGDREDILHSAVMALHETDGLRVVGRSPIVATDPVGGPAQGEYLNAVVQVECWLAPFELLDACQQIEADHDRIRGERWGPRTLDIDIITYGQLVDDHERLHLPHPRAFERAFVLVPWSQLDPDAQLPGPNGGPVALLAERAPDLRGVRPHHRKRPPLDEDGLPTSSGDS